MDAKATQARLMVFRAGIVVVLAILLGRLWHLQIARWSNYDQAAHDSRMNRVWTPAPRGAIYDRNGVALADGEVIYQLQVTRDELPDSDSDEFNDVVVTLATVLGGSTVEVEEAIEEAVTSGSPDAVLPDVGESLTRVEAIKLSEHRFELPGMQVVEARRRRYPNGATAAHLLGYARAISPAELHGAADMTYAEPLPGLEDGLGDLAENQPVYSQQSTYGKSGVELLCEWLDLGAGPAPVLQGRWGADVFEKSMRGEQRMVRSVPPIQGASVYLTIDLDTQKVVERALAHPYPNDPRRECGGGAAVVVDVRTGDILALASHPDYDPNAFVKGSGRGSVQRLLTDERKPLFNRAISGRYPPASTFKIISSCALLDCSEMTLNSHVHCDGMVHIGRRREPKKCWQRRGHGSLPFYGAVSQSCDIYFYYAVTEAGLTDEEIARYAREFGLGEKTGCGLAGEVAGTVPSSAWLGETKEERWYDGDTANMVIGQGYLETTPLQMAMATATIANDGLRPRAKVVRKIVWPAEAGREPYVWPTPEPTRINVAPDTLHRVQLGMRYAVTKRLGTARGCLEGVRVPVAAKTGSAENFKSGKRQRPHSWFVCYAPYDEPRYAIAVLVESGGHGSEVAGPVANRILKHLLPPDPS